MSTEIKSKLRSLLLAPVIIILLILTAGFSLVTLFESLNLDMVAGGILASQVPLLISGSIFFKLKKDSIKEVFNNKLSINVILIGGLITFVSLLINTIISAYLSKFIVTEDVVGTTEMVISSTSLFTRIIVPVIIAPTIEEFAFRAGLKDFLMRSGWGAKGYIVISSILFGLLHWAPGGNSYIHIVLTGVLGLLWSSAYIKTENIYIPIVSHSLYNLSILMIASY